MPWWSISVRPVRGKASNGARKESEMEKKISQGITFEIRPDIEGGLYSNVAGIAHSKNEFLFDFALIVPGKVVAPLQARIITNLEHAKQFLIALEENISNYEKVFGEIKIGIIPEEIKATKAVH